MNGVFADTSYSVALLLKNDSRHERAVELTMQTRGVVDCISFLIMREKSLADAWTTDHHFEQAGFRAMLK